MRLLVISPDYASHAVPLLTLAGAWRDRGHEVIVGTGPSVGGLVADAGMGHQELVMSRGSNGGVVRVDAASSPEARSLERFFDATREGMLETLRYQATARATDLLWKPELVARRTIRLVERTDPDLIIVDHLAFAATIGLRAMRRPYVDVVLGHPTALPVADETYGVPVRWPADIAVDPVALEALRATARGVSDAFTWTYDRILHKLDAAALPIADAFAAHGDLVLYAYPGPLHPQERTRRLPPHVFLGSLARTERPPAAVRAWLARPDHRPLVVASFGTFLSARTDVLARVIAALRRVDARVAVATGASPREELGELPDDWLVMETIPQVALLEHAAVLVTHGGNNSVTEALTHGVPMVVMPFSTDQFDGAAAIEEAGAGFALDPNRSSRPLIAGTVRGLLRTPPALPGTIADTIGRTSGPETAYAAIAGLDLRSPAPNVRVAPPAVEGPARA